MKEELDHSVVANFATTASDGKTYQVEHYNWDMIISVGYRVKSNRGVEFRKWANKVLKQYIIQGYKNGTKRISDGAIVAITLMIAESNPSEKDKRPIHLRKKRM